MTRDNANRVVMVGGADRGIGHATATLRAEAGYTLGLGIRSPVAIEQVRQD